MQGVSSKLYLLPSFIDLVEEFDTHCDTKEKKKALGRKGLVPKRLGVEMSKGRNDLEIKISVFYTRKWSIS